MRFQAGESDVINRVGGRNFAVLEKDQQRRGYEMRSAGPGLEAARCREDGTLLVQRIQVPG